MIRVGIQTRIQSKLPEDMQHLELGGMLGPHIVPFFAHTFCHYYTLEHLYLDLYYHFILSFQGIQRPFSSLHV
jgi:hypothetical protein